MLTTNRRTESPILNALHNQPTVLYINKFDAENGATSPSRKERRNAALPGLSAALHSCPYLAVVIYVTRDWSLLTRRVTRNGKGKIGGQWEKKEFATTRVRRSNAIIYIGCVHAWKQSGRACIVWESTDDKNGAVVFLRARLCVCVCVYVVRKREREMSDGICRLTSRNEFEQEIVAWASRESQQHHPNTTTRLRESPSPLLYITYHGKYT